MVNVYKAVARVAQTDTTVLLQGESGTGKELIARAIHDSGPRSAGPFITVDGGALAESLLESEVVKEALRKNVWSAPCLQAR